MNIKLSKVSLKDAKFIHKLRNEKDNRKNFIISKNINFLDHLKWFKKKIRDKNTFFFKIIFKKKLDCGYVRFDKKNNDYFVSICVEKKFRNKNIASDALLIAETRIPDALSLVSLVKKNNCASKLLFLKLGYHIEKKNKKILIMKKKNKLKVIDQIENIRGKNNTNWMNLLRLAYKKSPRESAIIMSKIYKDDAKISKLVKKLIKF